LVLGGLAALCVRVASSYFLTKEKNKFEFYKPHAIEVLMFGRWIFMSSLLSFLCANLDRLYIGKVAPLAIVGIFGIARNLADLPVIMTARVGYLVIFPLVSSSAGMTGSEVRAHVSPSRFRFLLACALVVAVGISISDLVVTIVYDHRYHDAAWMLPILLFGVWLSMICSVNEFSMLGRGKPAYNVIGNSLKLIYYLVMLPLSYQKAGILGMMVAIAVSDLGRYIAIGVGQWRERLSFFKQDAAATFVFLALVIGISWARWGLGYGTAFDSVPFDEIGHWVGRPA
jgi:O-antigen/teichoic acid export membrane protein